MILQYGLVCLAFTGFAFTQSNSQAVTPTTSAPVQELAPAPDKSPIAPDAPVITVKGVCDKSGGNVPADCKTVITREQ